MISQPRITIFILLYHIIYVSCQQCLSLNGTTTCNMFPTARISIRDPSNVTLPWLVNVSTVAEFDRQLLNYVNSSTFWDSEVGCTTSIHNRARYAVSLTCATLVFDNKCNTDNNTLPIPLCQSSCDSFVKSVEAIQSWSPSDSQCHAPLTSLSQQCNTNQGLNGLPSTGCVSAADHESSMCGFGNDLNTLCKYCNENDPTLSCCSEYKCAANKLMVLSGGAIAGIVIGTVSGLLICGLAAFCLIQRRQKRRSTYPDNDLSKTPESHMMRNVHPIEDEDYMEVLPDIHMNIDAESVKGHVFKVNSLEKQFVRVIYPLKSPENPDELELLKNDIIRMYYYFDDGWAFGDNFGSGLRGLFPILCVVNLTPNEVHELLYLSELPDEELNAGQEETGEYYSSIRHFSTGVQYDLDPRATIRLQNLRRTLTYREKSRSPTCEENNFHYLCASQANTPPLRTASMHATFSPRRLQDPLPMQDEDYFRSESSGSTAVANNGTPDSKTYLNGY